MEMKLNLPYPPSELLANAARRIHWAEHGRIAGSLREQAAVMARQQKPEGWKPLTRANLEITWYAPKKGKMLLPDRDSLLFASKSILDALQPPRQWRNTRKGCFEVDPGASIIASDSEKCIDRLVLNPVQRDARNPRTVIVIEYEETVADLMQGGPRKRGPLKEG